ncbi:MAG: hypothetical protein O7C75_05690 [Verrucomicrobia bacterium]|nr:hypothetical protein [Verrucomicrobiota bacterium]
MSEYNVVGTWAMNKAWNIDDGVKSYPWGNPSSGFWSFDHKGNFGLLISIHPALKIPIDPFSNEPQENWLSPSEPWEVPYKLFRETYTGDSAPYAYFGTYTVTRDPNNPDGPKGTLNLTVNADIMRGYTDTIQERSFKFVGNNTINVGVPDEYIRVLTRLT